MGRRLLIIFAVLVFATTSVCAQDLASLPQYKPEQKISGVIRNFGTPLAGLVQTWEDGFPKYHPDTRFEGQFPTRRRGIGAFITRVPAIRTGGTEPLADAGPGFNEAFKY